MATIDWNWTKAGQDAINAFNKNMSAPQSSTSGLKGLDGLEGLGWSALRTVGNQVIGGAVNQNYANLNSPYSQQVKDLFDATQNPIARAIKNWSGSNRNDILSSIKNDNANEDLFKFNITGSDNASLLSSFGYDKHTDEQLGIRELIKPKGFWENAGDIANQISVGATYGAQYDPSNSGIGAAIGAGTGLLLGINNAVYDFNNTLKFNKATNQQNILKRLQESSYRDDYLTQYENQVNNVSNMNYINNVRDYYGILRDGGSIHIKPENRGALTRTMKETGKSKYELAHSKNPLTRKRAQFAINAEKWNHSKDNGGPTIPPTFEEYYATLPATKNDTLSYDLRRAYSLLPYEEMQKFATEDSYHLPSVAYDENTDSYEFLKRKEHPTLRYELDWYNSNDPEAIEFRNKYKLDTMTNPYKYLPRFRNGGELGTMDDINNGFIDITNGGTHEQNPLGGVPVNIAEDGLPNLVEQGEMIYNGYVYSDTLRPSEETKKALGLKGNTYADVLRKAQKYSSERPDDIVAKNYDKYIATSLAMDQEQQKTDKYMKNIKERRGIKGHYADWGDWLHDAEMAAPIVGSLGQVVSDWIGNTNKYDYSEIDEFRKNAGEMQAPVTVGYQDVGQHVKYNPFDTDYMKNIAANQVASNNAMLRYASPTAAALQRNIQASNYAGQTAMANAMLAAWQQNDAARDRKIAANNSMDFQNAGNRMSTAQFNANAINRYREALAQRNLEIAARQAAMRSDIDAAVSNARNINRDTLLSNLGDYGKQNKIYDMIRGESSLTPGMLEYLKALGYKRCGGSIRRRK